MRKVLALTTSICAVSILTVAFVPMPILVTMLVGFIGGLSYPPVQPAVRTIYPKMVNSRQLTPLFSLDASAQEIIWVAGPVITTFIATQVSTVLAVVLCAVFLVGGGIWFISSPELGRVRIPRSKRAFGKVLTKPTVLLVTIIGIVNVGSFAAIEAGVVATFGHGDAGSGIVLAIWAIGSLVGGLGFGHLPIGPWALARRTFIILVGMVLASLFVVFPAVPTVWWLSLTLLIAGAGIAPALAAMFAMVSASVKFSDTAESYGWVGTGQLIGAALGSALAGFLIDANGSIGAFWGAIGLAVIAVIVAVVFHRALPDLRGRDASPQADTEPVPLQPS